MPKIMWMLPISENSQYPVTQNSLILFLGAFDDEEIIHVEGDVDPSRDLDIIHEELIFKDTEYINKHLGGLERIVARGGDKSKKPEYVSLHYFPRSKKPDNIMFGIFLLIHVKLY